MGWWLCHWAPWHGSARAAARSGDIRGAQVQTLLRRPLRDPYLLTIAVVCLPTSLLSLQFFHGLIRFVLAVVCLFSFCSLNLLGDFFLWSGEIVVGIGWVWWCCLSVKMLQSGTEPCKFGVSGKTWSLGLLSQEVPSLSHIGFYSYGWRRQQRGQFYCSFLPLESCHSRHQPIMCW